MSEFISNTIQVHIAKKYGDEFRFLVLKRADDEIIYPGIWQVVTGTCEKDERAIATAVSETFEETGITPIKFWTIPYVASFFDTRRDKVSLVPVFGVLAHENFEVIISSEHSDYLWLSYQEAIDLLFLPSHKEGTKHFVDYCLDNEQNHFFDRKV